MNGWLLDTNLVAELARPQPTARVQAWAEAQDEESLFLSILTLGEYDKGLHNTPSGSQLRLHIAAGIAALEARFADRVLPLTGAIVYSTGSGEEQPPKTAAKPRAPNRAARARNILVFVTPAAP